MALSDLLKHFRSAIQLPHLPTRKMSLSARISLPNRFSHLPRIFARALLLVLPAVLLVTFFAVRRRDAQDADRVLARLSSAATESQALPVDLQTGFATRPIFPYSIVPGGVRDANELQSAISADPVVAKHYSDFQIPLARTLRFSQPQLMFVSYRRNNRVFWTRNRMLIPAGETLLTDGQNLARVRCGNRLSPVAVKPVAASEPTTEELTEPNFIPPLLAELLPGDGLGFFPGPAAPDVSSGPGGSPSGPGGPSSPVLPPILLPGGPPITPGTPIIPPPVSTPEPPTLPLLLAGIAFLFLIFGFTRRFLSP